MSYRTQIQISGRSLNIRVTIDLKIFAQSAIYYVLKAGLGVLTKVKRSI